MHSPGPWTWRDKDADDNDMGGIYDAAGDEVCHFGNALQYYPTEGTRPCDEDKRLMLAAPHLFDAAHVALASLRGLMPDVTPEQVAARLEAAIARAEGKGVQTRTR